MSSHINDLYTITSATSARCSTWDHTGGNKDFLQIRPRETVTLAEIEGAGCIRHIYATTIEAYRPEFRTAVLRMYWDGEETPSVEVPFGDFFCVAHCSPRELNSLAMTLTTTEHEGKTGTNFGFNCYFPMPFAKGARITLENESDRPFGGIFNALWFHVDYEQWTAEPGPEVGRFHAQWRRENPTVVADDKRPEMNRPQNSFLNPDGTENYVLLEARGPGHLAGIHLQVDNIQGNWYGEGDDAIFIDGDIWPPRIHGTGSEEVFGGQACPTHPYNAPYAGFHLVDNPDWSRFSAMYRWYIQDPVRFQKDIRVTVEHGHANNYENDYASVAYWYQVEPHAPFPVLLSAGERMPRFPEDFLEVLRDGSAEINQRLKEWSKQATQDEIAALTRRRGELNDALRLNRFGDAPQIHREILQMLEPRD